MNVMKRQDAIDSMLVWAIGLMMLLGLVAGCWLATLVAQLFWM